MTRESDAGTVPEATPSSQGADGEDGSSDGAKAYLEGTVAKALRDGMMRLVVERPADPLRFLGQFLIDAANEEGHRAP